MTKSITLTRKGWIKHLAMMQRMLDLVGMLQANIRMSFPAAECEEDREDKINKAVLKLKELIWETGAVSERIHRERGKDDPDFDELDRDRCNREAETSLKRYYNAAKELEELARSLWDEGALEVATPMAVYPGPIELENPEEDPKQLRLGLMPVAEGGRLVDFKMKAAHDDTTNLHEKED